MKENPKIEDNKTTDSTPKTNDKKGNEQQSVKEIINQSADKINPVEINLKTLTPLETSIEKPANSVRLLDRVKQAGTDVSEENTPSSTLIKILTLPMQPTESNTDLNPPPPSKETTKQSTEVKRQETDTKRVEIKREQQKINEIQSTLSQPIQVDTKQNSDTEQKKPQPSQDIKTQGVTKSSKTITSDNLKPLPEKLPETQDTSSSSVGKQTEISVKSSKNDQQKLVDPVIKSTVSDHQPTPNNLIPSNIPQRGIEIKLGRSGGIITRPTDVQPKPNQHNISQQWNSPNLTITSDKGINRSVIEQTIHQKYNENQRNNEKISDPFHPTFFSAIDLKHSGFSDAETIEKCWNKLGVPDVENLLVYLGFSKHGMINLDHLTNALHEALEMNTYDEPSVLAGIRSMNMELRLTDTLKRVYEKEIENMDKNLTDEREMILRYLHQHLNEILQKMEILFAHKEVEMKQIQQKLDHSIQVSHELELKNKETESLLQTEDKFLNFITNLSDIMEAEIKQCEMCKKDFDHIFVYNEKIRRTVDEVNNRTQNVSHFKRLRDSIQILKDYSQLLQITVIKFAGIQRHTQFIINQEKEKHEKLGKAFDDYQKNLGDLQITLENLSRQHQKVINENESLRYEVQLQEVKIKSLVENNDQLNEKYQVILQKINPTTSVAATTTTTATIPTKNNMNNDDHKIVTHNGNSRNNIITDSNTTKSLNGKGQSRSEYPQSDYGKRSPQGPPGNSTYTIHPEENMISPYFMSKEQLAVQQYQNDLEETIRKQAKQIRQLRSMSSKYRLTDHIRTDIMATKDQ
ncbi:unnamed protein product [Heterobilharzia americana]|nr:unnamed protein product [Heterobilharzia americana]